jgi:glutathionylspermidine amidase/synthetase
MSGKTLSNRPENSTTRIQCVEFARRWLCKKMGLVFSDVDIAADIWDKICFYTHVSDGRRIPVHSIVNGAACPPKVGDLIVYGEKYLTTGHVAVTTDVDLGEGMIHVREQNYDNQHLPDNHVRHIPLIRNADTYWLLDAHLIGWKQIQEPA